MCSVLFIMLPCRSYAAGALHDPERLAAVSADRIESTEPLGIGCLWVALAAGALVALVIVLGMVRSMKSVRRERRADRYIIRGSMQLTCSRDIFLYSDIKKRARPKTDGRDD